MIEHMLFILHAHIHYFLNPSLSPFLPVYFLPSLPSLVLSLVLSLALFWLSIDYSPLRASWTSSMSPTPSFPDSTNLSPPPFQRHRYPQQNSKSSSLLSILFSYRGSLCSFFESFENYFNVLRETASARKKDPANAQYFSQTSTNMLPLSTFALNQ